MKAGPLQCHSVVPVYRMAMCNGVPVFEHGWSPLQLETRPLGIGNDDACPISLHCVHVHLMSMRNRVEVLGVRFLFRCSVPTSFST